MDNIIIKQLENKFKSTEEKEILNEYKKYIPYLYKKTEKLLNLEEIHKDLGYTLKSSAKDTLIAHFNENDDYTTTKEVYGATRKFKVLINMNTFLKLLLILKKNKFKVVYKILDYADNIINNKVEIINDDLLLLLNNVTEEEKKLFIQMFNLYHLYGNNKFVISLDDVWKWIGIPSKTCCKTLLIENFTVNIDYINDYTKEKDLMFKNSIIKNKHIKPYFLNVNTFKNFLLALKNNKAKIIYNILITGFNLLNNTEPLTQNSESSSTIPNDFIVTNDTNKTLKKIDKKPIKINIDNINNIIDSRLLQLLKEYFTIDEQNLFVNQFILYLKYGNDDFKFIINLDDIWKKWLGLASKDYAKKLLIKYFTLNKDYIDYLPEKSLLLFEE